MLRSNRFRRAVDYTASARLLKNTNTTSINGTNSINKNVNILFNSARKSPIGNSSLPSLYKQQCRHFISQISNHLTNMTKAVPDEKLSMEHLRKLKPVEVIRTIDAGWKNGTYPPSEAIVKEYLKAAAALKRLDSLDVIRLLTLIQRSPATPYQATGATGDGTVASLGYVGSGVGSGGSNTVMSPEAMFAMTQSVPQNTAGSSVKDPFYVRRADSSFWSNVSHAVKYVLSAFLVLSFVGALMDDKGSGAAAAISSRMGFASTVKQAEESDKCFADVVGVDEAKAELEEIVMYLRDSERFTRLGGKLPKGILLTGPPGTGKTLLARAVAGEAKVPFFYTSGSEFEEMYVGVGAKRVRELFEAAKQKTPCIIFIDEIDAIGGSRNVKDQSALKMTLNQLLVEMDGFEQNKGIIVIAATNFVKSLDQALVRPGRFDKVVDVNMPDVAGRQAILELYSKNIALNLDVDLGQLAKGTPGFTGADLQNLINQAAVKASVEGLKSIGMHSLEYAKDKILMGAERRSHVLSPETIKMTAFHEAGHALVALKTDGANPIHKATVMPRGQSLGMVMQLQDSDQTSQSRKQMLAMLDICMGGRVAEELIFGAENVTSGASSDIQQATRMAKAMVMKWGMSEKVGLFYVDEQEKQGGDFQKVIDTEIRRLLTDSYDRAKNVLVTNRKELDIIANGLIEFETLSGGEIVDLLSGVKPNVKGLRSQRTSNAPLPVLPGVILKESAPSTQPTPRSAFGYFKGEPVKATSAAPVVVQSTTPTTGKKTVSLLGPAPTPVNDVTTPPSTDKVSTLPSKTEKKTEFVEKMEKIEKKEKINEKATESSSRGPPKQ